MKITVNGTPCDPSLVGYNDGMNYGQRYGSERWHAHRYEMVFDRAAFVAAFGAAYQEICDFMKVDDEAENDFSVYREVGYAPLDQTLDNEDHRLEIVADWLARDHIFPNYATGGTYIINSVDRVHADTHVRIEGYCYTRKNAASVDA